VNREDSRAPLLIIVVGLTLSVVLSRTGAGWEMPFVELWRGSMLEASGAMVADVIRAMALIVSLFLLAANRPGRDLVCLVAPVALWLACGDLTGSAIALGSSALVIGGARLSRSRNGYNIIAPAHHPPPAQGEEEARVT